MKWFRKFSPVWVLVALVVFGVVVGALYYVSWSLGTEVTTRTWKGFALLGGIMAVLLAGGGFLGGRVYFLMASIVNMGGLGYMIYLAFVRTAEGWSDLVSIISYLFLAGIGVLLGIIGQLVASIRKVNRSRLEKNE